MINNYKLFLEAYEKRYADRLGKETEDTSKITKAILSLKGKESSQVTRLTKQLLDIKESIDELQQKKRELECESREICEKLFNAEDVVLTRALETSQVVLSISKQTKRESVNWKKAYEEISNSFAPSVIKKIDKIIKAYTSISDVDSKVTPKLKEEGFKDFVGRIGTFIKELVTDIANWARTFDNKLDNFRERYGLTDQNLGMMR